MNKKFLVKWWYMRWQKKEELWRWFYQRRTGQVGGIDINSRYFWTKMKALITGRIK